MPGLRGIQKCKCGPHDVFGWHGAPRPNDDFGLHQVGFTDLAGLLICSVNAPFVADYRGIKMGETPEPSTKFSVGLPLRDIHATSLGDAKAITDVIGARVTYDSNDRAFVTYITGSNNIEDDTSYSGDVESPAPACFTIAEIDGDGSFDGGTYTLPFYCRINIPDAAWNCTLGIDDSLAGGFDPRCFGFNRDGVVMVSKQRLVGGLGAVSRFCYSTGDWGVGYGEGAVVSDGYFICLPAQMAENGKFWVLAKEYNTKAMVTGIWENSLCYTQDSPLPITDPLIPSLPAVLTPAEFSNTIPMAAMLGMFLDWEPLAYTRREGHDYILAKFLDGLGNYSHYYWDGRRHEWRSLSAAAVNIYAFENGDVVTASSFVVTYWNADGSQRWQWHGEGSEVGIAPVLSGNKEWLQVKNVNLLTEGLTSDNYGYITDTSLLRAASTVDMHLSAGLTGRRWRRVDGGYASVAVSLSREMQSSTGKPICIIHRALDYWPLDPDTLPGSVDPIPFNSATAPYTTNRYATNETLAKDWDNTGASFNEAHRQLQISSLFADNFDCVPSCKCSCPGPEAF